LTRLSPKAEELVQAGRDALRPSEADRKRVFQALLPQLGVGAAAGAGAGGLNAPSTAPAAPAAGSGLALKVAAAVVVVGVVGGGFLALNSQPQPAYPTATAPVPSALAPKAPIEKPPESAPSPVPQAETPEKRTPAASSRPADSLAEEVAILSQASAELHAGRPAAALKKLEEHRRKFPRGAMGQERTSARIQALCALGRTKEAQSELARLARTSPNSPHVARARKACGSGL
jgi:hypothetical protein